jgi:predicted kinase/histidinol phosphatase-like enzyme
MICITTLGLPLSGKTTWLKKYLETTDKVFEYISADDLKESHPEYDPENTQVLHEWSVEEAEMLVRNACARKVNFIFDSGSINNKYTKRVLNHVRSQHYQIELVHIKTPYQVCLERNKLRKRKVPAIAITDKALKENSQFHKLKELVDEVIVIDYFTNEHIFIDMDGVIAAQTNLPIVDGCIDFVNGEIHKWQEPVMPMIEKLLLLQKWGYKLYILSAIANSVCLDDKNEWLDKNFNIAKENRYFVNQGRHKAEMLDNVRRKLKLDKSQVVLIEDLHSTLQKVEERGMKPMHVSEFLTYNFKKLN